jgi:integrase
VREAFDARVLRPAEIERLIGAATSTYRNAVAVMAYSGLRVSELAGLTWADIDLVDRVVSMDRQLTPLRRGEVPKRVRPKSRASVREVPFSIASTRRLSPSCGTSRRRVSGASRTTSSRRSLDDRSDATVFPSAVYSERREERASGMSPRRRFGVQWQRRLHMHRFQWSWQRR